MRYGAIDVLEIKFSRSGLAAPPPVSAILDFLSAVRTLKKPFDCQIAFVDFEKLKFIIIASLLPFKYNAFTNASVVFYLNYSK